MGINFILSYIISYLIVWEEHKTISDAKFSLVRKNITSQFINSALIIYFVSWASAYL